MNKVQERGTARHSATTIAWAAVSLLLLSALATPAFAHEASGVAGGFVSGFLHPILGWDHVAAMVAVGLWGAFLGAPAIWLLPIVFPLVMAFGGALGIAGVPLPAVETGIAASAVVLGGMVALGARPPLWLAAVIVGAFAVFHGHAHGTELPAAADAVAYAVGFVMGTGLLHLAGITFGLATKWEGGKVAVRAAGGAIAVTGLAFLTGFA
jgi:urease accessory protein